MKRYRIVVFDFDSQPLMLHAPPLTWEEPARKVQIDNRQRAIARYKNRYGEWAIDEKLQNIKDIGPKPFSIVAYHNLFLIEIRDAFIMGAYYPALVATGALGERILNHLLINLREHYSHTKEYKKVHRKESFQDWDLVISTLFNWGVLTERAADLFRTLNDIRNESIHFNLETEQKTRELSLKTIALFQDIIKAQFSAFSDLPWLFTTQGESYIKKEFESIPFVKLIYLPNCQYVGYKHEVVEIRPAFSIRDFEYDEKALTDEEFIRLREEWKAVKNAEIKKAKKNNNISNP